MNERLMDIRIEEAKRRSKELTECFEGYKMKKEICHVCGKQKKPYTVYLKNDIISLMKYQEARKQGAICERCDRYFAMTGEFKDASKEEFEIAKKSVWFANMLLKWWEKDKKMSEDSNNKRDWEGTEIIAKWFRKNNQKRL